jgi:PII-like signaling protein
MKGSQLTLYATNQRHRKLKRKVVDWVLDEIARAGIHGATVTDVIEGIDAHGRYHSSRFFELIDQPVAVMVAASDDRIDALIANLKAAGVPLFFMRCPIEFAVIGEQENLA